MDVTRKGTRTGKNHRTVPPFQDELTTCGGQIEVVSYKSLPVLGPAPGPTPIVEGAFWQFIAAPKDIRDVVDTEEMEPTPSS